MRILFFSFCVMLCILPAGAHAENEKEKFAVYYADQAKLDQFKPYQLIVLDAAHHPAIQPLKEDGKILLGYLSLGEVNKNSSAYATLKAHNLILQENPNWKDAAAIDIRDPLWARTVLEDLVPAILRQGFDGLFLDTLDSSIDLENKEHGKYAGMTDAAAHLVEAIRLHYPSIKIMVNRAYPLLPKTAAAIDMELGESIYTTYDFNKKTYNKTATNDYQEQVRLLQDARQKNPKLKIYSLDYASASDHSVITDIYRTERANGFIPYVATIGLDQIVNEPGTL